MKKLNPNYVVLMMIASQVVLSIFVLYWLNTQYEEEKERLHNDLGMGFYYSEQAMFDSVMYTNVINPLLKDSAVFTLHVSGDTQGLDNDSIPIFSEIVVQRNADEKKRHIRRIGGSARVVQGYPYPPKNGFSSDSTNNTVLTHGVKLFVSKLDSLNVKWGGYNSFFQNKLDSSKLINHFNDFVEKNYAGLKLNWSKIDSGDNIQPRQLEYFNGAFKRPFIVSVHNYQFYLLKQIFSQIIFALFLVLISALSFRYAYLNIRRQKHLLKLKNEFISNISHELKTPVATVKVALEAMSDYNQVNDPAIVKEYLAMSLKEMNRLENLVAKVLNTSMLENGKSLFVFQDDDLKSIIEEVIYSQKYSFDKKGNKIEFITDLTNAEIKADRIHLQGVILNLIDNSLKYGNENTNVHISLKESNNDYLINVKDNGPGIPEEYLKKVFDKFFRVPTNNKHNVKGYGLGLNYAQLVLIHHNGTISVVNNNDNGCEFKIRISKS